MRRSRSASQGARDHRPGRPSEETRTGPESRPSELTCLLALAIKITSGKERRRTCLPRKAERIGRSPGAVVRVRARKSQPWPPDSSFVRLPTAYVRGVGSVGPHDARWSRGRDDGVGRLLAVVACRLGLHSTSAVATTCLSGQHGCVHVRETVEMEERSVHALCHPASGCTCWFTRYPVRSDGGPVSLLAHLKRAHCIVSYKRIFYWPLHVSLEHL